jgi:hypothetical protein
VFNKCQIYWFGFFGILLVVKACLPESTEIYYDLDDHAILSKNDDISECYQHATTLQVQILADTLGMGCLLDPQPQQVKET